MADWHGISARIIRQRMTEGKAQGLEDKALRKFVDQGYPFGQRQYYPYKAWLLELKRAGLPTKSKPKPTPLAMRQADPSSYQATFFEGAQAND